VGNNARVETAWVIVVAAGGGTRFGARKQFARLAGATVVDRSLATAGRVAAGVVVVVPDDAEWAPPAGVHSVPGGDTRSASVRAGLARVPADVPIVVVHDAARPCASPLLYRSVIEAVRAGADAAVPAIAVTDTVKRVAGGSVVETIDREGLVTVQTPQAFRANALRRAHAAGGDGTDDAALVEAAGGSVVVVPGEARNLKITVAADLELAAALLERT
jgi:2-C-methyl-D-erythritol 4-phosphate cytidylyltransferase